MPWTCHMIESLKKEREEKGSIAIGSMWYAPWLLEDGRPELFGLSERYLKDHKPRRAPLVVKLPDGTELCVDQRFWHTVMKLCDHVIDGVKRAKADCVFCDNACMSRHGEYYGEGWLVTGTEPLITLSPSINIVGSYHGWLQNGVITDDCEGRKHGSAV